MATGRRTSLAQVKAAYALKERTYRESEVELRRDFGEALTLDVIDERAKQAWEQQWSPLIKAQKESLTDSSQRPEERYMGANLEPGYISPYLPPKGFKDDFEKASTMLLYGRFAPERFDLSIWSGETLCGLAVGSNVMANETVVIDVREGHPDKNHPLKGQVARVIDKVSTDYAAALGCKRVAYNPPFSEGALKMHQRMGLALREVDISPKNKVECYVRDL